MCILVLVILTYHFNTVGQNKIIIDSLLENNIIFDTFTGNFLFIYFVTLSYNNILLIRSRYYLLTIYIGNFIAFKLVFFMLFSLFSMVFFITTFSFIGLMFSLLIIYFKVFTFLTIIIYSLFKLKNKESIFLVIILLTASLLFTSFVFPGLIYKFIGFLDNLNGSIGKVDINNMLDDLFLNYTLLSSQDNSGSGMSMYDYTESPDRGSNPNPNFEQIFDPYNETDESESEDSSSSEDYAESTISEHSNKEMSELKNYRKRFWYGANPQLLVDGVNIGYIEANTLEVHNDTLIKRNILKFLGFKEKNGNIFLKPLNDPNTMSDQDLREKVKERGVKLMDHYRFDKHNYIAASDHTRLSLEIVNSNLKATIYPIFQKVNLDNSFVDSIWEKQLEEVNKPNATEDETSALWNQVICEYYPRKWGFIVGPENNSGKGRTDVLVKWHDPDNGWNPLLHLEYKSLRGDHWFKLISQSKDYIDKNKYMVGGYSACIKGPYVAFFAYEEDFHSKSGFGLKGDKFNGMLGLYVDKEGVKVLPQNNSYYPQLHIYDASRKDGSDLLSITTIFKLMSLHKSSPNFSDLEPNANEIKLSFEPYDEKKELKVGTFMDKGITKTLSISSKGRFILE